MEAGRMAIIQDPAGAMLAAWQPERHIGARRVNDPRCQAWNELQSRDPKTAAAFYSGLFGWEMEPIEQDGELVYITIKNAGISNGGIMPMTEQHGDAPSYWLTYCTAPLPPSLPPPETDVTAGARRLGGERLAGPLDIGAGRISVLQDPQGAVFAIFEGETDD